MTIPGIIFSGTCPYSEKSVHRFPRNFLAGPRGCRGSHPCGGTRCRSDSSGHQICCLRRGIKSPIRTKLLYVEALLQRRLFSFDGWISVGGLLMLGGFKLVLTTNRNHLACDSSLTHQLGDAQHETDGMWEIL